MTIDDVRDVALFIGGWVILCVVGTSATISPYPVLAFISVAGIGTACSVKGSGGCEMLLAMVVATICGLLLLPVTDWAWIAPNVPGGFMLSVVLMDGFDLHR